MERKFYNIFRKSIAARLLLLVSLLVGGGDFVWADTVLFDGSVASGWTYKNKAGTNMSLTANKEMYDGGGTNSPRAYTSTSNISISSTQTIKIRAKRSFSSSSPSIKVKISSDNGSSWSTAKEFTDEINTEYSELSVDNIDGSYYLEFEFSYVYISTITIVNDDPHPTPSNFSISSVSDCSATLSWTNGRDETTWEIAYSTDADFNPASEGVKVSVDSNPTTLTGLVEGVTYYAYVRANYSGTYSEWSSVASFQPQNEVVLNGSASITKPNIPIPDYTNNSSYLTKSQIIIPYSELSDVEGNYITQLTFYATPSTIDWGTATYDVYLAETATSYFGYTATFIDWENCTKVMENTSLSVSDGKLVLNLSTPFLFSGSDSKNLLIGFQQKTVSSSSVSSSWYTTEKTPVEPSKYYCAAYYNNGKYTYSTGQSYVPKVTMATMSPTTPVTLGTNGYTTFACPRPLDLANLPSGLKAYKASVTGTKVRFSEVNQAVPANTGVLLKGEAYQSYDIPFADSGSALGDNAFEVNSTGGTFDAESGYTYFGLIKNSTPLTFGEFEPSSVAIPTNKAYLKVLTSSLAGGAGARQLTFLFDENETTAIKDLPTAAAKKAEDAVFSITGQRVNTPTKGLYIINGKKHIIK